MKIRRLKIDGYKNIRGCDVEFTESHLIHAVIGSNGSGKSNVIEAILQILIGFYFRKAPDFEFELEFEAQNRIVALKRGSSHASITVDGLHMPLDHFAERLRDGPAQVFYPELTLIYYSGECRRVRGLVARYRRQFQTLTRTPETDRFRPLFVQSSNQQADVILLALFAHEYRELLSRLCLEEIINVSIAIKSPHGFDPELHEPKLWNTEGSIRRIVAALDDTASSQDSHKIDEVIEETETTQARRSKRSTYTEHRIYRYEVGARMGLRELARRLAASGDNLYLALENLRARRIFQSVSFQLRGRTSEQSFSFDELSEGEKQLIAVVGAIQLTNQNDNLILLDEPDTHLNPLWSWDYSSMVTESFRPEQQARSTVLTATHDPVMISGMVKEQVLLAHMPANRRPLVSLFSRPVRNPRGQGIANILCSKEYFGLPSSLDKETQKLLDERLRISLKPELSDRDKARLRILNAQLEIQPGVSERDPDFVEFLRNRYSPTAT